MDNDKLALYESLIRASLVLIFLVAITVGTFGVIAISQMLMRQAIPRPQFLSTDSVAVETSR